MEALKQENNLQINKLHAVTTSHTGWSQRAVFLHHKKLDCRSARSIRLFLQAIVVCLGIFALFLFAGTRSKEEEMARTASSNAYIKWVDFKVSYEALCKAMEADICSHATKHPLDWIELLAYTAAKTGGEFPQSALRDMDQTIQKLTGLDESKEAEASLTMEKLAADLKYYSYYKEAYTAVLGGYIGEYEIQKVDEAGKKTWETCYGLKAYSPIAKGFEYRDYDDFGASRTFGYKREHLGHDMLGQIGTPVIAVESGYVEALGWNRYGGWRIGIRSFDGRRYYYYAHLRQNYPYAKDLAVGSVVTAGSVIGYMGHTGYSSTENVNNIDEVHLHFGIQLIFDESQKEGCSEIWIDAYQLARFLSHNRAEAAKQGDTKEWAAVNPIKDPAVEKFLQDKKSIKLLKRLKEEQGTEGGRQEKETLLVAP